MCACVRFVRLQRLNTVNKASIYSVLFYSIPFHSIRSIELMNMDQLALAIEGLVTARRERMLRQCIIELLPSCAQQFWLKKI